MARVFVERREVPLEWLRLLDAPPAPADCTPPIDVLETDAGVEVLMDIPGVPRSSLEIVFSRNVLVIAGQKAPAGCEHRDAAFHVAERAFGRFARAISVEGAFDPRATVATLREGVLRVVLHRIEDRRGAEIRIPIR